LADYTGYYTYETMTAKLKQYERQYPSKVKLFSLGLSTENRELWCIEISKSPGRQDLFKPNVKYIGNMHGDEVVGRELLMRFIERLLTDSSSEVTDFVDNTNIFIVPTMNPDGFALGRRGNARNIDLNRNFPDQYRVTGAEEVETRLMKAFLASRQWTLSANFHGGDLVANYPWDGRADNQWVGENPSPDDDTFRAISMVYSRTNSGMMNNREFRNGITNGAGWYVLFGGMQDFNYIHHGCLEITLEVSVNKWPAGSELTNFYNQNKDSMFNYLRLVHNGVRGIVTDSESGRTLSDIQVTVSGREISKVKTRKENGAYFRILPAGRWVLTFSGSGYAPESVEVYVPAWNPSRRVAESYTEVNVALTPLSTPTDNNAPVASSAPNRGPWVPFLPPSIIVVPQTPQAPAAVVAPTKMNIALITPSDMWMVPMFAVVGSFAAVLVLLVAMVIFSIFKISITGQPQMAQPQRTLPYDPDVEIMEYSNNAGGLHNQIKLL
jgi:carboxypeptidase D